MSPTIERTLTERAAALAAAEGAAPFEPVQLEGMPMHLRQELVRWHGLDQDSIGQLVHPGRTVIEVPGRTWPAARPEECTDDTSTGTWFDANGIDVLDPLDPGAPEGIVLLCPQCGLDCT